MCSVYYKDRRVDADLLRELADEDPERLSAMLGINHAVRNHVGDVPFGIDRVLAGRLGVPSDGKPIRECGLFSSAEELEESLADAVYGDARGIVDWLDHGRLDSYQIDVNPAGMRPSSASPLSYPSVRIDDGSNALSMHEVHGIHVSIARDMERPLGIASVTCYPRPTPSDEEAGPAPDVDARLHGEVARTRAYASASTNQRLALLATTSVTDGCSIGYDRRRDRAIIRLDDSLTTYSMDATHRGLRILCLSPEGARRVWDVDADVSDEYNVSLMHLFYEDRVGYRTLTAMIGDAVRLGYPMADMPGAAYGRGPCPEPDDRRPGGSGGPHIE